MDFSVRDGWLTETSVQELADWYHEQRPETDPLTFEAHIMVLRTSVSVASDTPLDNSSGLSRARYNLLRMLYQQPDRRLQMSDFAEGMNVSPTNITKLVDTLVADGFVVRVTDKIDKRRRWAELTAKGATLVQETLGPVSAHVSKVWSCLEPSEKQVLIHLLAKVRLHQLSVDASEPARVTREYAPLG